MPRFSPSVFRTIPAAIAISLASTCVLDAPEAHAQSSGLSSHSSSSSSTAPWFGPLSSALGETLSSAGSSGSSKGSSELSSTTLKTNQPLPDEPGKLVARERVGSSRNERILYTSTNERGQIVPVSGAIYPAKSHGENSRKGTVVLAPGTRGMGDQCAPSAGSSMLSSLGPGGTVNINYEAPMVQMLLDDGYRVAVTDYMKNYAEQIRAFVPQAFHVLGTDGFGRSDYRKRLRDFFEVDRHWVTLAALESLAMDGALPAAQARHYGAVALVEGEAPELVRAALQAWFARIRALPGYAGMPGL